MSTLIRNINKALVSKQVMNRVSASLHTSSYYGSSLPSNVEEIAAQEKVCFSSNRHRDLSQGVVQSQTASVFGGSFKTSQSSQLESSGNQTPSKEYFESYEASGAINLDAAMRVNIPQPFAPVIDQSLTPNLSMPAGPNGQQNKYISNDMQETIKFAWQSQGNGNSKGGTTSVRYYSTKSDSTQSDRTNESTKDKLKRAVRDYGATVIVFHVSISITSLGICYAAVASGLDIPGYLTQWGIGGDLLNSKLASGASTFIVAYAVHKIMAPIRISITLASVPFIVRYLRKVGFLKKPPASSQ